jgi:hypothetical protein
MDVRVASVEGVKKARRYAAASYEQPLVAGTGGTNGVWLVSRYVRMASADILEGKLLI